MSAGGRGGGERVSIYFIYNMQPKTPPAQACYKNAQTIINDNDSDIGFNYQQSLTYSLNIDESDLEGLIIINIIMIY